MGLKQAAAGILVAVLAGMAGMARAAQPWGDEPFTFAAWVKTEFHQSILLTSSAPDVDERAGWKGVHTWGEDIHVAAHGSGQFHARTRIVDNQWHHVALVSDPASNRQYLYVNGEVKAEGGLTMRPDAPGARLRIGRGHETEGFTLYSFIGWMSAVRLHRRALSAAEVQAAMRGETTEAEGAAALRVRLDGDADEVRRLGAGERLRFAEEQGRMAAQFDGWGHLEVAPDWRGVRWVPETFRFHGNPQERQWERNDGLLSPVAGLQAQADRYVAATALHDPGMVDDARRHARDVRDVHRLGRVREAYLQAARRGETHRERLRQAGASLDRLMENVQRLRAQPEARIDAARHGRAAEELRLRIAQLDENAPMAEVLTLIETLERLETMVSREELLARGIEQLAFIRRFTYTANHYYTEHVNSAWLPGGNLCVLDVRTGEVRELVPEMRSGVFERFDISFDAQRLLFAWKAANREGHRIYEVNVDGSGLRQLTFPQDDEEDLVRRYGRGYHHGTDDMSPCYLPDGGIAFISTRCQYGTLCDDPDDFTTTVIYRMDGDGGNLRQLSTSALNESSPVMLEDGRLLYTRWEYLDKGAVSVKGLWSMRPDGTGSAEVYGNTLALPPTLIYGRGISGEAHEYVVTGTPHFPQWGVGTIIRIDTREDIRSRDPMTYMTPQVDVRGEGGYEFRRPDGSWYGDGWGHGPLFRDPYPLARDRFLVAHKLDGSRHSHPTAYGLYLLDEEGNVQLLHRDPDISAWQPFPLVPRKAPPVLVGPRDPALAEQGLARAMVTDVYHGMDNVERGTIRYIRVLEQRPRPWSARRYYPGDQYDQQHAVVTKDTHLGLKVQHGIVPVEEDGSANFLVPADASIFFQVLDEHYMAVQTERTFVNYMPGEVRSCIGCHETPQSIAQTSRPTGTPLAMMRPPDVPGPQPGEADGRRAIDYAQDVQPVWDRHCVECHSGDKPKGNLNLSGDMTTLFNVSYEQLVPERRRGNHDRQLLGPVIGENHPKTGNVHYLPPRSLGSHASVLMALLTRGKVQLADPAQQARAEQLIEAHPDLDVPLEDRIRVSNWVDTNAQYYGSYWGRRNMMYRELPDFRPVQTFDMATTNENPHPSWPNP